MSEDVPAIVLTMGRVSSSSVHAFLKKNLSSEVLHAHSIDPIVLGKQAANGAKKGRTTINRSVKHGLEANRLLMSRRPAVVISLVRDPIARTMSASFTGLKNRYDTEEELDAFLDNIEEFNAWWNNYWDRELPFTWFKREFDDLLGIDVYSSPFPESGALMGNAGDIKYAVLKLETPDEDKQATLSTLFDREFESDLGRANVINQRHPSYDRFKKNLILTEEYVESIWNRPLMQHFYSDVTLDAYKERWVQ